MNSYTRNRGPLGTKQYPSSRTKFLCYTVARAATSALNSSSSCSSTSMRFTAIVVPSSRIPLKTAAEEPTPSTTLKLSVAREIWSYLKVVGKPATFRRKEYCKWSSSPSTACLLAMDNHQSKDENFIVAQMKTDFPPSVTVSLGTDFGGEEEGGTSARWKKFSSVRSCTREREREGYKFSLSLYPQTWLPRGSA